METIIKFDLSDLKSTGTFVLFREVSHTDVISMTEFGPVQSEKAVLDISGLVRFNGTEATISSASGVLIFVDEDGNTIIDEDIDDLQSKPDVIERLNTIFKEDLIRACVMDALRGILV